MKEIDASIGNVEQLIKDVVQQIKDVEQQIMQVEIKVQQNEAETTKHKAILARPFELWSEEEQRVLRNPEELHEFIKVLRAEKQSLRNEKQSLRNKEQSLLNEKQNLLDKEQSLRIEKQQVEEIAKLIADNSAAKKESISEVPNSLRKGPTPSMFARPSLFFSSPEKDFYVLHRPFDRAGDPVTLLHPIFARFVDNAKSIKITSEDVQNARQLQVLLSSFYNDELGRNEKVNKYFTKFLNVEVCMSPITHANNREMDGGAINNLLGLFALVEEVKNELGAGGACAYLQHCAYYGQSLPSDQKILEASRCPAFGIYIAGPFIGFTGLVFAEKRIHCDPLTPFITCAVAASDEESCETLARILKSFKIGVLELLDAKTLDGIGAFDSYPYLRCLSDKTPFTYEANLGGPGKFVYKISITGTEEEKVIKFTRRYGIDAHRACANLGYAPAVLDYGSLPGGWVYVVMDFVEGTTAYELLTKNRGYASSVSEEVKKILQELHKAGYVHGDVRLANIVVNWKGSDSTGYMLIDFDFGGKENEALYPLFLNPDIKWAEGVTGGESVRKEHDMYFADCIATNMDIVA